MAKDKTGEVVYDEEFSARVNREMDMTETILRKVDGVETLILRGKSSKFKPDRKYRISITEVPEPEPEPEPKP